MSDYLQIMSRPEWVRLGWALVHFLWQGLVIAAVLEIALALVGRKKASARYALCGLALGVMPLCLMGTYLMLEQGMFQPRRRCQPSRHRAAFLRRRRRRLLE